MTQEKQNRTKLIVAIGGKGGVGKTFTLLSLCDTLTQRGAQYVIIDGDTENKDAGGLGDYQATANRLNLRNPKAVDGLLGIAQAIPITILDLPAGAGEDFLPFLNEISDPEIEQEYNVDVWIVGVITHEIPSIQSVSKWINMLGPDKKYIIVLNKKNVLSNNIDPKETFYNLYDTAGGKKIQSLAKYIIVLDGLRQTVIDQLHRTKTTFSSCEKLDLLNRKRAFDFITKAKVAWQPFLDNILTNNK